MKQWPTAQKQQTRRLKEAMIREVTVTVDLQTIDATLPYKLMGGVSELVPGTSRQIPGGMLVFQAAFLNSTPGETSLYRFIIQFGARQGAAIVGNWLFGELYGTAAAIQIAGYPIAVGHHEIIAALKQLA